MAAADDDNDDDDDDDDDVFVRFVIEDALSLILPGVEESFEALFFLAEDLEAFLILFLEGVVLLLLRLDDEE